MTRTIYFVLAFSLLSTLTVAQTKLLRSPDMSDTHVTFAYGSDIWTAPLAGGEATRITSTQAVESSPHFSPDGKHIAFSSNRSGATDVYVVPTTGGAAKRLTWHPSGSAVRGWTNDGQHILFASSRGTAPTSYNRLYTISKDGGVPSLVNNQWGFNATYSPDGKHLAVDKMSRWDVEWRAYRGGQNTPLIILNPTTSEEMLIPNDNQTTDTNPVWMGDKIYFLSDRDLVMNIWAYNVNTKALNQVTTFTGSDIKHLAGKGDKLIYERDGEIHVFNPADGSSNTISINVTGDFPWANTKWEDVSDDVSYAALSPNGKRAIFGSRGDIFTSPVKNGDSRNITKSSGTADRAPIWSPKGDRIAWFSDYDRKGYKLIITDQDGRTDRKELSIGQSKMAWDPTWSPDGDHIAFVDDDVRLQVINVNDGAMRTVDTGGTNLERGSTQMQWSPDSKWITYSKTGDNNFRRVYIYSMMDKMTRAITDPMADSFSPVWDLNKKQLYFLASTDVALGSGWANTSSMQADPVYAAYVVNLDADDPSPFRPKSDEEEVEEESEENDEKDAPEEKEDKKGDEEEDDDEEEEAMKIDFDDIGRRTMPLPMSQGGYRYMLQGPAGSVFLGTSTPESWTLTLKKFDLEEQEATDFMSGVSDAVVTANGEHLLVNSNRSWQVASTGGPTGSGKPVKMRLQMKLDRAAEWTQIFEEAWRYQRDYFYDPGMHGRDWQVVYDRYAPLVPYVKHRADLNYILDQTNGELSVGHSFVFGGDMPDRDRSKVGMLGADIAVENGKWRIKRIYTTESWNPGLTGPLDAPGLDINEGDYILGINGEELNGSENIYERLDGTLGRQTTLHISDNTAFGDSHEEIIKPIRSENGLRQRTWVEDNRRLVDKLSGGRLAYVWVPNTAGAGFTSFNRYYFAQQDKDGAVIDERFNGGGLLDDYMVDLMTRELRASLTNEVPNGKAMRLPAGILGPKALLINELSGSGGDFFPWVFRQQNAGPLIGATTWGGLVKSSVHYSFVDGGAMTAPDNAVFDPNKNEWVGENVGIAPDIPVRQDAKSLSKGGDPQLERAVQELMKSLPAKKEIKYPVYPKAAKGQR